jgi:transposase-like protein
MPWREVSTVDQRREFVALASLEGANRRALCRRFGISAQTGYKWLSRAARGAIFAAPATSPAYSFARMKFRRIG